jgi:hypothetical protein
MRVRQANEPCHRSEGLGVEPDVGCCAAALVDPARAAIYSQAI